MNAVDGGPPPIGDGSDDCRACRAAVEQWFALEEIARKEPSLPVWRPRTKRQRARFLRIDARWRALLARARELPGTGRGTGKAAGRGWI